MITVITCTVHTDHTEHTYSVGMNQVVFEEETNRLCDLVVINGINKIPRVGQDSILSYYLFY
jgi:hypothetical protein